MKKILILCIIIAALAAGGCASANKIKQEEMGDRFVLLEIIDRSHVIVVDKVSRYEYFGSSANGSLYIIGGNVLNDDGKPVKFLGEFPVWKD